MEIAEINKKAWEYRAYEFWNNQYTPEALAERIKADPKARLRYHQKYFENVSGMKIANVCGSNGRIAVPLACLGAEVTVFDISEENKRYSLELAAAAGVNIAYVIGDFMGVSLERFSGKFDIAYLEGGILHYFHDLDKFFGLLRGILKPGAKLILSDFHPYRKINLSKQGGMSKGELTGGDYFDSRIHRGDVAYKSFFPEEEREAFPECSLRFYTLSEIINACVGAGLVLREFLEHPNWENKLIPGEFTIFALRGDI